MWNRLLDVMGGAMIDLKALDPVVHVNLTARDNTDVLTSVESLADKGKLALRKYAGP